MSVTAEAAAYPAVAPALPSVSPLPLQPPLTQIGTLTIFALATACLVLLFVALRAKLQVSRMQNEESKALESLKRRENVLRGVFRGTSSATGGGFFQRLVCELSAGLGCTCAAVVQLEGEDAPSAGTLAAWAHGTPMEELECDLRTSPCRLLLDGASSVFAEGVQGEYPDSPMLRLLEAESFAGTPLHGQDGDVIGLLFVMDSGRLDDVDLVESILAIASERASAEIERVRAQRALRLSEGIHRQSIEYAAGIPYRLRFADHLDDSRYEFIGEGISALLGVAPGEMDHRGFSSLIEEQRIILPEGESDPQRIAAGFRDGRVTHFRAEIRIGGPTGRVRWLSNNAVPWIDERTGLTVGTLGILHDITESKRRERVLHDMEAALISILRVVPIGIGLTRSRVLEWVSDHICAMVKRGPEELIGQSARILYPSEEEFERVGREKYAEIESTGVGMIDTQWIRSDGKVIDVDLRSTPINPENFDEGVTFTALDITERKRSERERQRLEQQILRAQKLESLGVLAGGIAHDFNNLLVAMLGNASLALADLPPGSPSRGSIQQIEIAAERAADLCRQMLAYSGRGQFEVGPLDLSCMIKQMAHILEITVGKRVALNLNLDRDLPMIDADSSQIHQVVINLVTNAAEAIGDGSGAVTVATGVMSCDSTHLGEPFFDQKMSAGEYVFLEVTDDGCGMDAETRANIFDPFFTTKFTGRGLGMAAVLGIVRGHRGAVKVHSEEGRGTSIRVLFALSESQSPSAGHDAAPGTQAPVEGQTILIVDDEQAVRHLMDNALRRAGFETITAADGQEGVETLRLNADAIDAVILDLTMPRMDGGEAFRKMKQIRPELRVILASGHSGQEVEARFTGEDVAGFIQKPFRPSDLVARLCAILHNERRG